MKGFKVGPDYLDTGYQRFAAGAPGRNLDLFMMGETAVLRALEGDDDVAVIEGVMGLFDGHHDVTLKTSTADVAKHVGAPVILVTDASRMAASAGALALGFRTFDSEIRLAGVILNRWRPGRKKAPVEAALARAGVETLGYIPAADDVALPSRHLGLVVADEVADQTAATMALLGEFVEQHVDVDRVLAIAGEAPDLGVLDLGTQGAKAPGSKGPAPGAHADGTNSDGAHPDWSHTDEVYSGGTYPDGVSPDGKYRGLRIAVAWDAAFAFYYADNLDLLRAKGVEVVPFSPLSAAELPVCDGLYLGGGYPELHAQALSMNEALRSNLTAAIAAQLPTYAECGGLVYLCESLTDLDGRTWPLVGALPAAATMHSRLQALGYREARLHGDSLLGPAGAVVRGHEFHYASCDLTPAASPAYWVDGSPEGYAAGDLFASFIHLHFAGVPAALDHWLERCLAYARERCPGGSVL